MRAYKLDMLLMDKAANPMFITEFFAPAETNIDVKEREKRVKYKLFYRKLRRIYPE